LTVRYSHLDGALFGVRGWNEKLKERGKMGHKFSKCEDLKTNIDVFKLN
jgi:hypothetical protein